MTDDDIRKVNPLVAVPDIRCRECKCSLFIGKTDWDDENTVTAKHPGADLLGRRCRYLDMAFRIRTDIVHIVEVRNKWEA